MSSDRRVRAFPFRLKTLGGAVAAALLAANVHAAALGNLTVLSALGQPLQAEIELISTVPEDTASLLAKVASFDTFRKANIDYNPVLSSLRFSIEQRGDRHFIRVTSAQPINEPFVDLLLELRGTDSRLVREYLFLLDPPPTDTMNAPAVASPATVPPANPGALQPSRQPAQASRQAAARAAQEPESVAAAPAKPARPAATQHSSNNAGEAPVRSRQPASGKARLSLTDISVAPGGNATFAAEERAAMEKAVAEANERVKALEQKVDAMQKLLAATNNLLAELRKHNEMVKGAAQAEPAAAAPSASASAVAAASTPAPAASAFVASADAKPAESAAASVPLPAAKPAIPAPVKPRPAPPPPANSGLLDALLDNLYALSVGGLALLLLGGAGAYFARRRRQQQPFDATLFTDSTAVPDAAPAPTAGQDADGDTTVYIPGFSDTGASSDTGHDPVAEADVYIAYGRDGQAEQILKDALQKQPERQAVRLKLLSIYASRKDRDSFERLAAELHAMTKGQGEEWARAAALGAAIDPGNAMYAANQPRTDMHVRATGGSGSGGIPAIPPAEPVQGESGDASGFDFTRGIAPVAESASVPGLPSLDAAPPTAGESAPIDLDFALGIPPAAEEPAPEVPEQAAAEIVAKIAAEIPPLEPELPAPSGPGPIEFELPALPLAVPKEVPGEPAQSGYTASGPGPIDFELPELPLAVPDEPTTEAAPKAAAFSSDPGAMDFDLELPEIPALAQPEEDVAATPQAAGANAGAAIDLDGMLADLLPPEKKPE